MLRKAWRVISVVLLLVALYLGLRANFGTETHSEPYGRAMHLYWKWGRLWTFDPEQVPPCVPPEEREQWKQFVQFDQSQRTGVPNDFLLQEMARCNGMTAYGAGYRLVNKPDLLTY